MRTKQEILKSRAEECSRQAELVTDPLIRHDFLELAAQWLELAALHRELEVRREEMNGSYRASGSKARPEILIKLESWRRDQRRAFEMATMGEALETALAALVRGARNVFGGDVRAAFYLANPAGTALHHVVGMPAAYAEAVDGFKIGADSLACGLATHIGRPILTADVATDPRWTAWRGMADKFDYRGCWSFPIRTGTRCGSFAIYSQCPREATAADVDFAELITLTAAILITRHIDKKPR